MKAKRQCSHDPYTPVFPKDPDSVAPAAVTQHGASQVCTTHVPPAPKRVRFTADTSGVSHLHRDDFLRAFQADNREDYVIRRAATVRQHVLHIDHAHAISLGYFNQRYWLVMVIDGVDFLWGSSSAKKSNPEQLLEEFLLLTQVKIGTIRMDAASEMAKSEAFQLWCKGRGITLCPTAGYNHTMQGRAEGAVRITKEHIRCLLKHANMPFNFWPWALTQFCSIYNYWPNKGHAPPWILPPFQSVSRP